jgi:hypothetical protein
VVYQPGASGNAVGITLTLVSIGFCALYTVFIRRLMLDDSSLTVVLAQQAAALVFAIALASVVELAGGPGWDLAGLGAGNLRVAHPDPQSTLGSCLRRRRASQRRARGRRRAERPRRRAPQHRRAS